MKIRSEGTKKTMYQKGLVKSFLQSYAGYLTPSTDLYHIFDMNNSPLELNRDIR